MVFDTSVATSTTYIILPLLLHVLIILEVSHAVSQQDLLTIHPSPREKTRPLVPSDLQLELELPLDHTENDIVPRSSIETEVDGDNSRIDKYLHEHNSRDLLENNPRIPRRIFGPIHRGPTLTPRTTSGLLYQGRENLHNVISSPRLNGNFIPSTVHDPVILSSPKLISNDFTLDKYPLLEHSSHVLHPNQLTETYEGGWRPVLYPAPYNVVHHKLPKSSYSLTVGDPYIIGQTLLKKDLHHESYKPRYVINHQLQDIREKPSHIINDFSSHFINHNPHSLSSFEIKIPHKSLISQHIHDYSSKPIIYNPLSREMPLHHHKHVSHQRSLLGNIGSSHVIDHYTPYTPQPHTVTVKPSHVPDHSNYDHVQDSYNLNAIDPLTKVTIGYAPIHITTHGPAYKQPKSITFSNTYKPLNIEPFKAYLTNKYQISPNNYHNGLISPLIHSKSTFGMNAVTSSPYNQDQKEQAHNHESSSTDNSYHITSTTPRNLNHESSPLNNAYHITTTTHGYRDLPAPDSDYYHPTTPTYFHDPGSTSDGHGTQDYNHDKHSPKPHHSANSSHNDDINSPLYYDQLFSDNRQRYVNDTTDDFYLPQYPDKIRFKNNQINYQ